MKKGFTEIICVIDRSGSMGSIKDDAIGGFNSFLEAQQKLPGEASLTYVQFDQCYEVVHENKPLQDVPLLDEQTYVPRGTTALLDAIGKTITDVGKRLSNTSEESKPEKVIMVILTDGQENSSREYRLSGIKDMITHQKEKYLWEFMFLGANQDAFEEAAMLGIDKGSTISFDANSRGVFMAYNSINKTVSAYRGGVKNETKSK